MPGFISRNSPVALPLNFGPFEPELWSSLQIFIILPPKNAVKRHLSTPKVFFRVRIDSEALLNLPEYY